MHSFNEKLTIDRCNDISKIAQKKPLNSQTISIKIQHGIRLYHCHDISSYISNEHTAHQKS